MELAESDLLFIDVDATTPAVKQEQEETPGHESSPEIMLSSIRSLKNEDCITFESTSTKKNFSHHKKKKASSENRFKCNTCDYITYHRALFQEHINRHEGIKPYKCELCSYSSVSKKYAKQHQDKHKTCPCGFLSRNAPELRRHMAKCGNNAPIEAVTQKCPSCNKEYVDEKALAKHRLNRHTCSICHLQFCGIVSLKMHMLKAHNMTDQSIKKHRFQCAMCSWTSSLQQKILLHLIHHPQEVDSDIVDVEILRRCGILPFK